MDIKAYIESGILEAYVLGSLTEQEAKEVRINMSRYPEVEAEVYAIEDAMFKVAQAQAVTPPALLQDRVWNAISATTRNAGNGTVEMPPMPRVIPLPPDRRSQHVWKYAAMIAMLVSSVVLNFILWQQGSQEREGRIALAAKMDKLFLEQKQLANQLGNFEKANTMMADTGMQTIVMHTMLQGHPMAATLYWSKAKGEAFVAMNALPEPPKGMQYQLWVIQGGKPISMGTLPNDMANSSEIQKINMPVMTGEAFAISLEKEGGNAIPTAVYVLGKV
jgi:anti-sigma-K factor RskA